MAVCDLSVWDLVKGVYHCGSLNVMGHNLNGALLGGVALLVLV